MEPVSVLRLLNAKYVSLQRAAHCSAYPWRGVATGQRYNYAASRRTYLRSIWLTAFLLTTFEVGLSAQEAAPGSNRAYVEFLGGGLLYSLNYEHRLAGRLSLRVGAGGLWATGLTYYLGLGGATWRLGRGPHSGIIGLSGGVVWFKDVWILEGNEEVRGYAVPSLGYRFQPKPRGVFLQAAFTPIFADDIAPWAGVGVGIAF